MRTEAQIEASRANGRRSQGPVTPEGKARSSQNAYRHGLLAATMTLRTEDKDAFGQYLDQHLQRFQPADDVELNLVEKWSAPPGDPAAPPACRPWSMTPKSPPSNPPAAPATIWSTDESPRYPRRSGITKRTQARPGIPRSHLCSSVCICGQSPFFPRRARPAKRT
jgi:hypothetical protein